jgi:peptide/nickel transport system substrate-binding protein
MPRFARALLAGGVLALCILLTGGAFAQKRGGVLQMNLPDSPGGLSILEEATQFAVGPMMGVMSNLLIFDQQAQHNSLDTIVPDLATGYKWSEDGKALTLPLRQGVRWHDGKPFTAKDVLCTWDLLMETGTDRLRINPRKAWYLNVERLSANGDFEITFHLKRPQPAFPMLLAAGVSPVYPCHVPARDMRTKPIGTGPFKFVEFKANQLIRVVRNPDYWKPERPYLDGIDYVIVSDPATAALAFTAGKFDMTFPQTVSAETVRNIQAQKPDAICEMHSWGGLNVNLMFNRDAPPFDNPDVRKAMALSMDRQAFVDIVTDGKGDIGGAVQPPPGGLWGMPDEMLRALPGYDTNVAQRREEARRIMRGLGYGPENRLKVKLTTRNLTFYRTPAVVAMDQMKEVFFDVEMEVLETPVYFPRLARKEFAFSVNLQTSGPDPDTILLSFYSCGGAQNYDRYCNKDIDALIERQSMEADRNKRKQILWEIERRLVVDNVRPVLFYFRNGSCWHPYVKNVNVMRNSAFSGHRREDIWLDR